MIAPHPGTQLGRAGSPEARSRAGVALGGEQPQHAVEEKRRMTGAWQALLAGGAKGERNRVLGQRTANVQYQQRVARQWTSAAFLHFFLSIEDVEHRADFQRLSGRRRPSSKFQGIRDENVGTIVRRGVSVAEVVEEFLAVDWIGLGLGYGPGTDYQWKGDCRCNYEKEPACCPSAKTHDLHLPGPSRLRHRACWGVAHHSQPLNGPTRAHCRSMYLSERSMQSRARRVSLREIPVSSC
jgi:hypothetical protein